MKLKKNAWRFISQLQSYQPRYNNTNFNFIYIYINSDTEASKNKRMPESKGEKNSRS
jgi:hypothetical protein